MPKLFPKAAKTKVEMMKSMKAGKTHWLNTYTNPSTTIMVVGGQSEKMVRCTSTSNKEPILNNSHAFPTPVSDRTPNRLLAHHIRNRTAQTVQRLQAIYQYFNHLLPRQHLNKIVKYLTIYWQVLRQEKHNWDRMITSWAAGASWPGTECSTQSQRTRRSTESTCTCNNSWVTIFKVRTLINPICTGVFGLFF